MLLRSGMKPSVVMRFGLVSLATSILVRWGLRATHFDSDAADGLAGFLLGLALGALLLALWMDRRGRTRSR